MGLLPNADAASRRETSRDKPNLVAPDHKCVNMMTSSAQISELWNAVASDVKVKLENWWGQ
jgi:hypothetical protein